MDTADLIVVLVLAILPIAGLTALVDIARRPRQAFTDAGQSRIVALWIVILTGGVGGIAWFLWMRRRVL